MENKSTHIAVIGGAGHVGLPLSLLFAQKGYMRTPTQFSMMLLSKSGPDKTKT